MGITATKHEGNTYVFKVSENLEEKTYFQFLYSEIFLLSDYRYVGTFQQRMAEKEKLRKNMRRVMRILLKNQVNELHVTLIDDRRDIFMIEDPILNLGRTAAEAEAYRKMDQHSKIQAEPSKIDIILSIPAGSAVKIYSIESGYKTYLVNNGHGIFCQTNDIDVVEDISGAYF